MSKVAIVGNPSGTGVFTIQSPNTSTDRTLTLPDETGTVLSSGGAIDVNASAPADSISIDSSGRVGIGTSSPSTYGDGNTKFAVVSDTSGTADVNIRWGTNAVKGILYCNDVSGAGIGIGSTTSSYLGFLSNGTERMRIDSSGVLMHNTTAVSPATTNNFGTSLGHNGTTTQAGIVNTSANGNAALYVNRGSDDGSLVLFWQNATLEGSITVSGTTVSYNGGHLSRWSQLIDGTKDESIVKGTVMTNLDKMAEWVKDGVEEDNEQLNCMAVSSVEGDPNVAGVFVSWDNDDDDFNDMNIAMTGDMVIRIAQGTTVERGNLLMSAGDGTAKPQEDDIVRSKTIAKVTSTHVSCTYPDGSYCVPCVLMAC